MDKLQKEYYEYTQETTHDLQLILASLAGKEESLKFWTPLSTYLALFLGTIGIFKGSKVFSDDASNMLLFIFMPITVVVAFLMIFETRALKSTVTTKKIIELIIKDRAEPRKELRIRK